MPPSLFRPSGSITTLTMALAAVLALAGCQTAAPVSTAASAPAVVARAPQAVGPFVATANPLATEAGLAVLRRGGSAVDAAVAVQAVLGLVEPQSSGLGGGAFMMLLDAATGEVTAYDGRETAPSSATGELFYEDGKPLSFIDAVMSGRSIGAPGAVAMLAMAQAEHGVLPWSGLFDDAERLAREGFVVSPRLAGMIAANYPSGRTAWSAPYFTKPDGSRYVAGDLLKNSAYAQTLTTLAEGGADAFYRGPIAQEIAAAVASGPRPGGLTAADIAAYEPLERGALCRPFRIYLVCVPPPPSSGVSLLQLLAMAEDRPELAQGPQSLAAWTAFAQLQRLMYADRDRYVGDPAFVGVPVQGLLDEDYVAGRAALVDGLVAPAKAGTPPGGVLRGPDATLEPSGTSHFFIVDAQGGAVSMTTTVESVFGSGRMVGGFFLNNQMTDFSFTPNEADGTPAANAPGPLKRPRSSMAPVIVLDREGRLVGGLGSPGGPSILAYNAKALIGALVWDLPMQAAIDLPNLVARGTTVGADTQMFTPELQDGLAAAGVVLRPNTTENSGLQGGLWRQGSSGWGWDGGADKRREGTARTQ